MTKWIPVRLIVHNEVFEDEVIIKKDGNWTIIDFKLPPNSSNTIVLSSSNIPPLQEEYARAIDLCYEFTAESMLDELDEMDEKEMDKMSKMSNTIDEDKV